MRCTMKRSEWDDRKVYLEKLVLNYIKLNREIDDEELQLAISEVVNKESKKQYFSLELRNQLIKDLFDSLRRLDVITDLIDNHEITEIMVNGPGDIYIEKEGLLMKTEKAFSSKRKLEDIIQKIASNVNRRVNEANPIVDARLSDGSRVNIVLEPVALNGPVVTIRRFPEEPLTMNQLIQMEAITREAAEFLKNLVVSGYNIFISGGTGSGKTTFLSALTGYIPENERVITIEDSSELRLPWIKNLVQLETREANVEGNNEITIRQLIKTALRMRPDRIIVGEIRSSEAIDMLMAMNTGHDGSLSTGHANSPIDMIARIETMVLMGMDIPLQAIRRQIASAIDIIIHLGRLRDKSRKVLSICEVAGIRNGEVDLNCLYYFKEEKQEGGNEKQYGKIRGSLVRTDKNLLHKEKLQFTGLQ